MLKIILTVILNIFFLNLKMYLNFFSTFFLNLKIYLKFSLRFFFQLRKIFLIRFELENISEIFITNSGSFLNFSKIAKSFMCKFLSFDPLFGSILNKKSKSRPIKEIFFTFFQKLTLMFQFHVIIII